MEQRPARLFGRNSDGRAGRFRSAARWRAEQPPRGRRRAPLEWRPGRRHTVEREPRMHDPVEREPRMRDPVEREPRMHAPERSGRRLPHRDPHGAASTSPGGVRGGVVLVGRRVGRPGGGGSVRVGLEAAGACVEVDGTRRRRSGGGGASGRGREAVAARGVVGESGRELGAGGCGRRFGTFFYQVGYFWSVWIVTIKPG